MVLITSRPEYQGALTRAPGAQTIALAPLSDSDAAALLAELLGSDPSVGDLAAAIADRAAGNPFFAEEMVRELVQRGVLRGDRGGYVCRGDVADVAVPATVQAAIEARIDRLNAGAKRTVNAASVIGARFGAQLLTALETDPVFDELLGAELIDQVKFTPQAEYAFRHPLIRTVAYESQLKSDRAKFHRRLASAIEARDSTSADEDAALIAEHWEAAGDLHAAYSWHMRAGAWLVNRDIAAARLSWERAQQVSDALPIDDPDRLRMRIAALTLLCGSAFRVHADISDRFDELQELCVAVGDKASIAIGMTGVVGEHFSHGRLRDASRLASEQMALIESIGDETLTLALCGLASVIKHEAGEFVDMLRWSQTVIDLADSDPNRGNLFIGTPLGWALAQRGFARWALNKPGWRDDFDRAIAMVRATDPMSYAYVVNVIYNPAITCGLLLPSDTVLREIEGALRIAERVADDVALGIARTALGIALVHRDCAADRERGLELLEQLREMCLGERYFMMLLPFGPVYIAREKGRRGDRDGAVALLRKAVDDIFDIGQLGAFVPATAVLVETLLARGTDDDVREAEAAVHRLASAPEAQFVARDITLLRLRALMARACGDENAYEDLVHRYRAMATSLCFEGHTAWANLMA
jgi:hypothetical protein